MLYGCMGGYPALAVEVRNAAVHGLHSVGGLQNRVNLVDLLVADKRTHRVVHRHYLKGRDKSSVHRRKQLLAHHGIQHHGKLHADLVLLIYREYVDNTVNCIRSPQRMQR